MGQHFSGVARSLASNNYNTRRQLHPEELRSFLVPLYDSLLQEIGYTSAVPLDIDAVTKLHKVMQQKADVTGLDYQDNAISAKAFTLGLSLVCVRFFFFFFSLSSHVIFGRPTAVSQHLDL